MSEVSSIRGRSFARAGMSALVLTVIGGVGYWGHVTHWKLGGGHAGAEHVEGSAAAGSGLANDVEGGRLAVEPPQPLEESKLRVIRFKSPEAVAKSGIETTPVIRRSMDECLDCNGAVDYDRTRLAELTCRVPAIVWRVDKHLGEAVHQGDVLAILESSNVGDAKAELLQALGQVELKEKVLARLDPAVVAKKQIQEAEAELTAARIALFNAQQQLVNLGLPIRAEPMLTMSDSERARMVQFLGLPDHIKQGLDPDSTTANLIPLVAPFDGVVIGHEITVGEVVDVDKPQLEIADVRLMWVTMYVRQEDAARLAVGQPVTFTPDGSAVGVHSQVSWISTEVDPRTRTVSVRAVVENPMIASSGSSGDDQRLLRANSYGKGRICVREKPDALVAPNNAVQSLHDSYFVFARIDEVTFEARPVKIGAVSETDTEILSGVNESDVVATVGSHLLKSELQRTASSSL